MKKILLILILFGIAGLFSCSEDLTENPATRRIVNETEFAVRVEVFGDESNKFIYNIPERDSIDIEGICTSGVETYCDLGWITSLAFGKIYFNDEKVQNFEGPSGDIDEKFINADPLGGGYGYVRSDEGGVQIYTYRITQEDYENAEPL